MPVTAVAIKGQHVREFFLLPPAGPPERFSGLPCKIRGLAVAPCPPGCVLVGFPMSSAAEIHLRPRAQTNIFLAKRPCPPTRKEFNGVHFCPWIVQCFMQFLRRMISFNFLMKLDALSDLSWQSRADIYFARDPCFNCNRAPFVAAESCCRK